MTVSEHEYTATLLAGGSEYPLGIRRSGRIVLDESRAPHVQADLDLALPDEATQVLLDPRQRARVRIDVDATFPTNTQARSFDLSLRARPVRHGRGAFASVSLASDEAILDTFRAEADDETPLTLAASLRSVVDYVLDTAIPGAALEASPANDADVTPYWRVSLLNYNPSGNTSTTGYWASTGTTAIARAAPPVEPALGTAVEGTVRWTAAAGTSIIGCAGWDGVSTTKEGRVTPGRPYSAVVRLLSSVARSATVTIGFRDENGASFTTISGAAATTSTSAWTEYFVTGIAPVGAAYLYVIVTTTGNSAGQFHWVQAMVYEGKWRIPMFHGASSAGGGYEYSWEGDPHLSPSTRTPDVPRDPESLVWRAGDSALDFLRPLVQAAGYRLVCDENRKWTLRDEAYAAAGSLSVREGVNLISGDDVIDIDQGTWYDARATIYRWTDRNGIPQEQVDYYEHNTPPYVVDRVEINAPYPGPGRSEYAVRRAQGRGREVTVTAVADWRANAEQPATFILDSAPIQTGQTSRVEFDLSTDRMTVRSRTIDTPVYAWSLIPEGEAWDDSPVGESWIEEVV